MGDTQALGREEKVTKEECIFIDRPRECSGCLRSKKLQCLLNKQHLIVRPGAYKELHAILKEEIRSPDRYKTKSGEEGRHG